MNILLINPFAAYSGDYGVYFKNEDTSVGKNGIIPNVYYDDTRFIPYGLMYIAAYLKQSKPQFIDRLCLLDFEAHRPKVKCELDMGEYIDDTLQKNCDFAPDIVGISALMSLSHVFVLALIEKCKAFWPKAKIILGGFHATNYMTYLFEDCQDIDFIIRGEGEVAFANIVEALASGDDPATVLGVYDLMKAANQTGGAWEISEMLCDLNALPFIDYTIIDIKVYLSDHENYAGVTYVSTQKTAKRTLALITSRGCPGVCTFCCAHTVHGRRVRTFSLEKIIETIAFLYLEYGVNTFSIYDDFFTFDKKRVLDFAARMKALSFKDIRIQFEGTATINSLDEALIEAMIELGLDYCVMPLESGAEYVQKKIIKKNVKLDHAVRMAEYMRSKGVFVNAYIIFGFPYETHELMMESLYYAMKFPADRFFFFSATPYLGSEMTEQFLKMGCFKDERDLISQRMSADERSFDMPGMPAAELNEFKYRANLLCNFAQNVVMRNGEWRLGDERFSRIYNSYPFHIIALKCKGICCQKLGRVEEAEEIEKQLQSKIENDLLAAEMYKKYRDIFVGLERWS